MGNVNRVFLMGRLTRDPELRYTKEGTPVCKFGMAVNSFSGAKDQRREKATFVDITAWDKRAEVITEYFKKGSPIFLEGRLELDQWEGEKGEKRSKLYVVAERFEFLERAPKTQEAAGAAAPAEASAPDLPQPKDDIPF